jgi:hypothetical protein
MHFEFERRSELPGPSYPLDLPLLRIRIGNRMDSSAVYKQLFTRASEGMPEL